MLVIVLAVLAAAQPRGYEGPREAAASSERTEPIEPMRHDPLEPAIDRTLPPRQSNPTGRGLLIAGGIFAAGGLALASAGTALRFRPCADVCIDPPFGAMTTSILAPVAYIAALPFLGVGMQRRGYDRATRGLARPPRRGVVAAGAVMASVASVGMIAAFPFDLVGVVALWVGPPIAIAGALMAGSARGRRSAPLAVSPIVAGRMTGVSVAGRW